MLAPWHFPCATSPFLCIVLLPTALCFKSDSIKVNNRTEKDLTPEGESRANG
jgi:hypothetical protein